MQFSSAILLLLSASGLMASPIAGPNPEYIELTRESSEHGTLIYLGPSASSKLVRKETLEVEKRDCGESYFQCSVDNGARPQTCDYLISDLQNNSGSPVPNNPRQICLQTSDGAFCCVSWSQASNSLTKGDFVYPSQNIRGSCTSNNVSGKFFNMVLGGVCMNVCLSDRGTHCS